MLWNTIKRKIKELEKKTRKEYRKICNSIQHRNSKNKKYHDFVTFYDTYLENKVGLFHSPKHKPGWKLSKSQQTSTATVSQHRKQLLLNHRNCISQTALLTYVQHTECLLTDLQWCTTSEILNQ